MGLRIGTWNIHGALISGSEQPMDERDLADPIDEADISVVALQEVPMTDGSIGLVVRSALVRVGFAFVTFAEVSPSHLQGSSGLGLAIYSKIPLRASTYYSLPGIDAKALVDGEEWYPHDKGVLRVGIDSNIGDLDVSNCHLVPYHRFGIDVADPRAQRQIDALAKFVRSKARPDTKSLLLGDFNMESRADLARRVGATSVFEGTATRPNGMSHDDILMGHGLILRSRDTISTQSDHDLVVAEVERERSLEE